MEEEGLIADPDAKSDEATIALSFPPPPPLKKPLLASLDGASFRYPTPDGTLAKGAPLLRELRLSVSLGERIGVLGRRSRVAESGRAAGRASAVRGPPPANRPYPPRLAHSSTPTPPRPLLHAHSFTPTRPRGQAGASRQLSARPLASAERAPRPKRAPSVRLTCCPRTLQAERRGQVDSPAPAHAAAPAHERRRLAQPWRQVGHLRAAPHRPARPERIAAGLPRLQVRRCVSPLRACEPRAHHMHATCTLHAHHMHAPVFLPCTHPAPRTHAACTPNAHRVHRRQGGRDPLTAGPLRHREPARVAADEQAEWWPEEPRRTVRHLVGGADLPHPRRVSPRPSPLALRPSPLAPRRSSPRPTPTPRTLRDGVGGPAG